jgi:hypothetical protein
VGWCLRPPPTCQWCLLLLFLIVSQAGHDFTSFLTALLVINDQRTPPPCLGVSGLSLLGRPLCCRALPSSLPRHAGFPRNHVGRPVIGGHVGDVHCYPVLATDLARVRLSITVVDQQLSDMELKLWVTLNITVVAALSICTPSLCTAIGGILTSQIVAPTTSSPHHA